MHPIWGPRCIGIQKQDLSYWELHLMTYVSVACVDFGTMFPMLGSSGPYESELQSQSLVHQGRDLQAGAQGCTAGSGMDRYSSAQLQPCADEDEIETEFQKRWSNGAKFVSRRRWVLDTPNNLRARQKENWRSALMVDQCMRASPQRRPCHLSMVGPEAGSLLTARPCQS